MKERVLLKSGGRSQGKKHEHIKQEAEALIEIFCDIPFNDNNYYFDTKCAVAAQKRVISELGEKILSPWDSFPNSESLEKSTKMIRKIINHNKEILNYLKTLL